MEIIILIAILIIALSVHEAAHAFVAYKLGDPTPKVQGRVTLNPIKHLDPIGTAILVLTIISPGPGFGWGKPVQFNPINLGHPKRDIGIVAFAGPLSNIVMGIVGISILPFINDPLFYTLLVQFIQLNAILAAFNLIPIYPLDGYNVVLSILPNNLSEQFSETSKYGTIILLVLILTGAIGQILLPILNIVNSIIYLFS